MGEMAAVVCRLSCFDVADYFIWLANETGSFVSNLKLQKLVYYAQAWHIAIFGEELFPDDFQAWIHGPVIPDLYHSYKSFGWSPILKQVKQESLLASMPSEILDFLQEISEEYFSCDAYELERMTHAEDPWLIARGNLPPDAPSCSVIEKEWMHSYYGSKL
jgi:uncharacterized phage-associated protein